MKMRNKKADTSFTHYRKYKEIYIYESRTYFKATRNKENAKKLWKYLQENN